MKIGIMQPYIFPYIGYWQLIANTQKWVFFDIVQYNKKSWMNRNRILHPDINKETQYVTVPIKKHKKSSLIKDVFINNEINWRKNILGKLTIYRRFHAPFYDDVTLLLKKIFDNKWDRLIELSIFSTLEICKYLGVKIDFLRASEIDLNVNTIEEPGQWALSISKALDCNEYINPYGGYKIFNENEYIENGVSIRFLKPKLNYYQQGKRNRFVKGLSIIDFLMFNGKSEIENVLKNEFELLAKNELVETKKRNQ